MRYFALLLFPLALLAGRPAFAVDLGQLASCTTAVFSEIHHTRAWSGKVPSECPAGVRVDKYTDGVLVTAWARSGSPGGEVLTAFSVLMTYPEIAASKALASATRDVAARSRHLEQCLNSILTVNDPLDCRYKATKEYSVGETTGTERRWLVWLDDAGRQGLVEHLAGDIVLTPDPPVDLYQGEPLPPGIDLHLLLR